MFFNPASSPFAGSFDQMVRNFENAMASLSFEPNIRDFTSVYENQPDSFESWKIPLDRELPRLSSAVAFDHYMLRKFKHTTYWRLS